MATARRTKRQRERVDQSTGFTRGEMDDLRDKVENRFARVNRVGHSVDTQARQMSTVDQRARLEAATGQTPANERSERIKDPTTDDVRQYRHDKFGIEDLRTATAEQIEQARKDPEAFRRGRVTERAPEDTRSLAAAQAAAQGGVKSSSGGKPASFTGYPGGRRPPGGGGPLAAALGLAEQRNQLKRKAKKPRLSVGGVTGGSG